MPPKPRANCQICNKVESKYTCSTCLVLYCSVPCYKDHKASSCSVKTEEPKTENATSTPLKDELPQEPQASTSEPPALSPPKPLRPLTSLKWPYVPEPPAYPDPLTRDDPKPLQLHQYEAIATSPEVRNALTTHERLPSLLRSLDALEGREREEALQRVLGVGPRTGRGYDEEDAKALRELAEAIEKAVRPADGISLGLDWN